MRTPDITPAQLLGIVAAAIALAVAFGAPITDAQSYAILGFVGTLAAVLFHSDAKIRHGRASGGGLSAAGRGEPPEVSTPPAEPGG